MRTYTPSPREKAGGALGWAPKELTHPRAGWEGGRLREGSAPTPSPGSRGIAGPPHVTFPRGDGNIAPCKGAFEREMGGSAGGAGDWEAQERVRLCWCRAPLRLSSWALPSDPVCCWVGRHHHPANPSLPDSCLDCRTPRCRALGASSGVLDPSLPFPEGG